MQIDSHFLNRGIYNAFADTFDDPIKSFGGASRIDCQVDNNAPVIKDCSHAKSNLLISPARLLDDDKKKKRRKNWAGVSQALSNNTKILTSGIHSTWKVAQ